MDTKKASFMNWFWALILILFISTAYFAMTKPFQFVDNQLSPQINFTKENTASATNTNHAQEVINKVRMYWVVWPILIIAFLILWAFFSSLKQDPNFPYQ